MRVKLVTSAAAFVATAIVREVRVGGTANTAGIITITQGATLLETIPAASPPGTSRSWNDTLFDANAGALTVTVANAADSALVFYT